MSEVLLLAGDHLMGLGVEGPELISTLTMALVYMNVYSVIAHLQAIESRSQLPMIS